MTWVHYLNRLCLCVTHWCFLECKGFNVRMGREEEREREREREKEITQRGQEEKKRDLRQSNLVLSGSWVKEKSLSRLIWQLTVNCMCPSNFLILRLCRHLHQHLLFLSLRPPSPHLHFFTPHLHIHFPEGTVSLSLFVMFILSRILLLYKVFRRVLCIYNYFILIKQNKLLTRRRQV